MMTNKIGSASASAILVLIAAACAFSAAPASAQSLENRGAGPLDPVIAYGEQLAAPNTFFLNSSDDVEVVRFKREHDLSICAAHPPRDTIGAARRGYAIKVSWDNNVSVVTPGNCLSFEAQRVKVAPASALPESVILTGTVRVMK